MWESLLRESLFQTSASSILICIKSPRELADKFSRPKVGPETLHLQQTKPGEPPAPAGESSYTAPSPAALPQALYGELGTMSTPRSKAVTPAVLLVSTSQRDLASRCQEQLLNSQKNKILQTHPVVNWQGSLATWPQTIAWSLGLPAEVTHGEGCVRHLAKAVS